MMLRTKIFRGFVVVILIFSVLSAILGVGTIKQHVTDEAQQRVRLDLSSAWAVHNSQMTHIETILRLVSQKQKAIEVADSGDWKDEELFDRLSRMRVKFDLDFLNVLSPSGQVMIRTRTPRNTGDHMASNPLISRAMGGETVAAVALMSQEDLKREGMDLAERAFLELEATPRARKTSREVESRGMVMMAAAPLMSGNRVIGVVYGGKLLNRNYGLIDEICNVVYRNEEYGQRVLGTATIFLHDSRITTTVRNAGGNRALGTRVSKEVADQVLDNGKPWIGEAFVVNDWYLSAYEPIHDIEGNIIGMLYVGILKAPFDAYGREIVLRYLGLTVFVLLIALVLAFLMANKLAQPIHKLVEASVRTAAGKGYQEVQVLNASQETENLVNAYNTMTRTLSEREQSLRALNRSYMETLGFVSHELKSPLATMLNYVFLLKQRKIGDLTEKQAKAVSTIDNNLNRLVEMVRHYLNLSRIENNELSPVRTRVAVLQDVVNPIIESAEHDLKKNRMRLDNRIDDSIVLFADINMVREVFENLVSNAIKYGRPEGLLTLTATPQNGFVEFAVWNEGEGLTEKEREQLFGKFARLGQAAPGKPKGTGLGLFITKHIVEGHGGAIHVRSEVGQWVEFVFTLPRLAEKKEETANG